MSDFLQAIEMILVDMWNYLHVLLQYILNGKTEGENEYPVPPVEDPYV